MKLATILLIITFFISGIKDIAEKQGTGHIHNIFRKKWPYYLLLVVFIGASFWKEQIDDYAQDTRDAKMESLKDSVASSSKAHYRSDSIGLVRYLTLQSVDKDIKRAIKREGYRYDSATGGLVSIKISLSQSQSIVSNSTNGSISEEEKQKNNTKNIAEPIRKKKLSYWENQAQVANASVDNDKATLNNVQQYHFLRMPDTRKQEIRDASNSLERDKSWAQRCSDSIKNYQ